MILSDGTTTISLPEDLAWVDRYSWSPVVQEASWSLDGALIVESGTRQAGRPITLTCDDQRAWLARAQVEQLAAWADTPGLVLTLSGLRGEATRQVMWRHQDAPACNLSPLFPDADQLIGEWWMGSLSFLEV